MKILLILFGLTVSTIFAQTNISKVSLEAGYVRNYQSDFGNNNLFTISPGIKIGGEFITDAFEWDLSLSYWHDGIDQVIPVADQATYSYNSTNIELHLNYFPTDIIIPIHFITGFSTRFINEKYIGGSYLSGSHRNDNSFPMFSFDFGTGLNFEIEDIIRMRCDLLVFMPLSTTEILPTKGWSSNIKIGIDYKF